MFGLLRTNWFKNVFLEDLGWIQVFFEKHFISYSFFLFIKYYALRSFCIKLLCFSKIWFFQIFNRSSVIFNQLKNSRFLSDSIGIWSMLDWSKLKNFQFLSIWPIYFFSSFMFRIHMHYIVFCIHLAVL